MHHQFASSSRARLIVSTCLLATVVFAGATTTFAQAPTAPAAPARPPQYVSNEVATDGRITFRLFAPQAQAVRLNASDIPGMQTPAAAQASTLVKGDNNVWAVTVGPVPPGAYRYTFVVDGVSTVDPRNPVISESNTNVSSLVLVPGHDLFDTKDVPHGAVASVIYKSKALGYFRRMHVYTPPGYENGQAKYPVFYLLHGAGDNDNAWSTVGRAGIILDNLIATGKARPMIVVMPAGHISQNMAAAIDRNTTADFANDFTGDVMPYVETHYRVLKGRANTAMAGLSMGGGQTLQVAIPHLEQFGYIGVYSSGLLGAFPDLMPMMRRPAAPAAPGAPAASAPLTAAEWEKQYAAKLDDPALKKGLTLFWFATGKEDFLLTTTKASVDLFKKHGFAPVFKETEGGHTWSNWRDYLADFAPQLFQTATGVVRSKK
jgi:enterochelin esterase-like enzyme